MTTDEVIDMVRIMKEFFDDEDIWITSDPDNVCIFSDWFVFCVDNEKTRDIGRKILFIHVDTDFMHSALLAKLIASKLHPEEWIVASEYIIEKDRMIFGKDARDRSVDKTAESLGLKMCLYCDTYIHQEHINKDGRCILCKNKEFKTH